MQGEVRGHEASKASMIKNENAQNLAPTECVLGPGKMVVWLSPRLEIKEETGEEEKMPVGISK